MNLFSELDLPEENLLPCDGTVLYYGEVFNALDSQAIFQNLLHTIEWRYDQAEFAGNTIQTKRKVAWYGDQPYNYTYSNTTKVALAWTDLLVDLKKKVESITQESYNSCLLNLYHNGQEAMSWHSDNEKALLKNGTIASLSFGATRVFALKHKNKPIKRSFALQSGSLLVMKGTTQSNWLHRITTCSKTVTPRINLTFRSIQY